MTSCTWDDEARKKINEMIDHVTALEGQVKEREKKYDALKSWFWAEAHVHPGATKKNTKKFIPPSEYCQCADRAGMIGKAASMYCSSCGKEIEMPPSDGLREDIESLKMDDRPEIQKWLISKDYTKGFNDAISRVLALIR